MLTYTIQNVGYGRDPFYLVGRNNLGHSWVHSRYEGWYEAVKAANKLTSGSVLVNV